MFTAVLTAYTVQKEWGAAEAFVRGEAVSDMLDRMTLLQTQFNYALGNGEHERIAQEMLLLSSGPEPQIAMLADDAAVVLGATNGEWVGRSLTEVAQAQWPGWSGEPLEAITDRVRVQFTGELYLAAAGRYVLGIYPVMLGARAGSLPAEGVGVLLVQRDLSRQLAHARRTVGKHWVEMTGVLVGLAVILGILIHLLVTRRLNTLLNVTQRFAAGNLEARADLRGTDEVAILGWAFDRMAEQVADTQRQLERRVQKRTEELGQTISELSYHASHDALTGLVNRRESEHRLERILARATQEESHAVIYLDLDQFKVVNDTCGHIAGDELLRQVGAVLASQVRKRDTLARLGGDEFGALLEHCQQGQALRIAYKMREALQDFRFVWQDRSFTVGASIGLVPIKPGVDTLASVFRAADDACYAAKDQGRNRVHLYQPDDHELAQRHGEMQWVPRIQEALASNRFSLFYQPIIPLGQSGQPHGEVLLRLLNRDGDLIPPSAFIPAAERYNQMQAIDRWVIRTVFAALCDPDTFPPSTCVAINLSGQSLSDQHFLEFVEQQIENGAIPLDRICFEITETAAISNLTHAKRFFSAFKPRGCRFALDDFGSGLSSFAYLKALPVDFLKIDGGFVKDMVRDPIDYAMVEAIHRIGHVMGIKTVAESVENERILAQLKAIGVNYAQGYEVGKPRPLGEKDSTALGSPLTTQSMP